MANVVGDSNNQSVPAVDGKFLGGNIASPGGIGVRGASGFGPGVQGNSGFGPGVQGTGNSVGVEGHSGGIGVVGFGEVAGGGTGVRGENRVGAVGLLAAIDPRFNQPVGAYGESPHSGVVGISKGGPGGAGVIGFADQADGVGVVGNTGAGAGTGVHGHTSTGVGVLGTSDGNGPAGRFAASANATGALAQSERGSGVIATSSHGQAVSAFSDNDIAVFAQGATFAGVFNGAFVVNKGPNPKDPAVHPSDINGSIVINEGSLFVNKGDILLGNAGDCAEDFEISGAAKIEPGTVMVFQGDGEICESTTPYDKRVAGVISGAGGYKPGLILDRQLETNHRAPLALIGKVFCRVDARYGSIEVGDLLTTSSTTGHAMKATDPVKAFGAVIGKALRPLKAGQGLIPILVSLQ
jgi:hypothetical protein